jgi:pimeloyl-ACP methyl ester carboxylesterase
MDAIDIPRAVLVAASMGGEVALAFALDHPDRVAGLVLVDTLAGIDAPSDHLRAGWRAMEEALDADDLDRAVEIELGMWVDGPHRSPADVDPAVRDFVREMDLALLQRAGEHEHAAEQDPVPPVRERLGDIRCPVLVVHGALDVDDARISAEVLVTRIPDVRQAIIPDAAHLPSLEDPARFNALAGEFLASLAVAEDSVG